MKLHHNNTTCCAECQSPLKWWRCQTCALCGHRICSRHSLILRRPHSSVLFAVCLNCRERLPGFSSVPASSEQRMYVTGMQR